ncbi:hypothetical protein QE152_g9998 [Popillia japonica]|uniref:Uncharacterized protein n=1 Tax=Popillia japonica TaxID=7064 RepID=A0AAW1LT17_POPJA
MCLIGILRFSRPVQLYQEIRSSSSSTDKWLFETMVFVKFLSKPTRPCLSRNGYLDIKLVYLNKSSLADIVIRDSAGDHTHKEKTRTRTFKTND